MNISNIVIQIDAQISRLQQAKAILTDASTTIQRKPGRPAGLASSTKLASFDSESSASKAKVTRTLSAEARAKIAAAQTLRWAKVRKVAKKQVREAAISTAEKTTPTRSVAKKLPLVKKSAPVKNASRPSTRPPAASAS